MGKKKRDRGGGAPEPGNGMTIDAVLAQLSSMKETAEPFIDGTDPDADKILKEDVEAIEAATAILSALQDEGVRNPEEVLDLIHDYRALAEQYRTMHQHYIEQAKPERLGSFPVTVICPKCHRQVKPVNSNYCGHCGKRLGWG